MAQDERDDSAVSPVPRAAKLTLQSHARELMFLKEELANVDGELKHLCQDPDRVQIFQALTSVPGVGPITATSFLLELFNPERFERGEQVASYLGLAPTVHHSGERTPRGRLVPVGQKRLRSLLVEAAWRWIARDSYANGLYRKFLSRSGIPQKAIAAVARKLAVILWRLSVEQRAYRSAATAA